MATTPYAGLSDLGRKRARNDDRWGADAAQRLYIVADGVGSTSRGDLAAGLVVELLPRHVARHLAGADLRDAQAAERLGRALLEMCNDLYARSRTDPDLTSADTTVVAGVITDSRALIAHLGDSRAYLYRDGQVQRLTKDHTIVQAALDAGEITAEQAAHHPNRSVVTRHVLMPPPAKPDVSALDLHPGDRILLSSDGLHGVIDDATLAAILTDHPDPADACRALTAAANQAGGPDNITAVVVDADRVPSLPVPAPEAAAPPQTGMPPAPPWRPRQRRGLTLLLLAFVVVLVAAAVAAAAIIGYLVGSHHYASQARASQAPSGQTTTTSAQTAKPPAGSAYPDLPHTLSVDGYRQAM